MSTSSTDSSLFSYSYEYISKFTSDSCPDSLAWNNEFNECFVACIYPFFSDSQIIILHTIDYILVIIGFILTYIYCLTALLRPIMKRFPNSIISLLMFSFLLTEISLLFPIILGEEYIFCNSTTEPATHENSLCLLTAIIFQYGFSMLVTWFLLFHLISLFRIYLIKLPKYASTLFYLYGFFGWPFIYTIVGASIDVTVHFPSLSSCAFAGKQWFAYTGLGYEALCSILSMICIIFICIRMIRVKVKTQLKLRVLLAKQFRLFFFWIYYTIFVGFITGLFISSRVQDYDGDDYVNEIIDYRDCVLRNGDDEDCSIVGFGLPPFSIIVITRILTHGFPIAAFIVFGGRKEFFLFWKEYIQYIWNNKTIPLQFNASIDPSQTISQSSKSLEDRILKLKKRINAM